MANKIIIFVFVSLLLTSFSLGCIHESENNSSEIPKNILEVSENTDSNPEPVNVASSAAKPGPISLVQTIQISDVIIEATVVDIETKQITLNDRMDMPYEVQHVYLTLRINEILKPNQDIKIGEEIIEIFQGSWSSEIGSHVILMKITDERGPEYAKYEFMTQKGEVYSNSAHQISLDDMRTLVQNIEHIEKYDSEIVKKIIRIIKKYDLIEKYEKSR